MKRIMQFPIGLVLLLVFSTCNNKKEAEKNITQTVEDENQIINTEFLNSSFYTLNIRSEISYDIKAWMLKFFSNGEYNFRPPLGGDIRLLLKYIEMPYGEYAEYKFDNILKEDWELEYTKINNSLYYSEGLVGKGIIFGREKSSPKVGDIIKTNEYDIVSVQRDHLRLQSDVIVRIGPGINFQHCIFEWYDYDENNYDRGPIGTSTAEYVRKNNIAILIGHSINTDTIDGLTGYWYYCWIPIYPDMGGKIIEPKVENNSGWIFGPSMGLK